VLPTALSEDRTAAFHDDGLVALVGDRLRGPPPRSHCWPRTVTDGSSRARCLAPAKGRQLVFSSALSRRQPISASISAVGIERQC